MTKPKGKIRIPENELRFRTSRSAGPGGQNVNKLNTKVTVLFTPTASQYFTPAQKRLITKKLAGRIRLDGTIGVSSQRNRSQRANKLAAVERLTELIQNALKKPPLRKKTKPTISSVQKRLAAKKRRSLLKQQRLKKYSDEGG